MECGLGGGGGVGVVVLSRIIDIFKTVFLDTLIQEHVARTARRRFNKAHFCFATKAHNIHVGTLKKADVAKDLHNVALRVNAATTVAGAAAS